MMRNLNADTGDMSKVEPFVGKLGLSSPGYGGSKYAYKAYDRWSETSGMKMNLLPLKCLTEGTTWFVNFKVKLEDGTTGDGVSCDPSGVESTGCPYVWLRVVKTTGQTFDVNIHDDNEEWDPENWNSFSGHVTITADFGPNIKTIHTIFTGGPLGSVLILDDLSWTPTTGIPTGTPTSVPTTPPTLAHSILPTVSPTDVPTTTPTISHSIVPTSSPTGVPTTIPSSLPTGTPTQNPSSEPCGNMMIDENGESSDPLSGWKAVGSQLELSSPGYGNSDHAFKTFDRWSWRDGVEHDLGPLRCLVEGTTWIVSFKARLEDEKTGEGLYCDSSVDEYTDCPLVWLRVTKANGERSDMLLRDNGMAWNADGWNTFKTHVTITDELLGSGLRSVRPIFAGGPTGSALLLDDFAWIPK
jgi:hypothetical protein